MVLIYLLKIYRKKTLQFYWEKSCSVHYLHFSFEKHVPSQVLKDFSVENLETNHSTFFLKFSSEFYFSRIITYWGIIFTLYLKWGAFNLFCVLSVFFFLSFLFFFIFYWYFPWQTLAIHRIAGDGERIMIFLAFYFYLLRNIHLLYRDFYHFCLIDIFVITRVIADETCSS